MEALEMFTGMVLRPMQGPLPFAQELELMTLKNTPWDGKALAESYETALRMKRTPRL